MPQPSFLSSSLMVAAGGGLGAWLRYAVGLAWTAALGPLRAGAFPFATLTVNVAGSLAMGLLAGWLARHGGGGNSAHLLLGVGMLGGFTTFSSFSLDVVALIERGQPGMAALYIAASLLAGIGALFAGLILMRTAA